MKNATHLLLLADRSGSMQAVREEATSAINVFIEEQKKVEGECYLTLIDFDMAYETVYDGPIEGFETYDLVPRGMTALLDAIGRSVDELGEHLADTPEEERPSNVIVIIQTDGQENSSSKYTAEQVKAMITRQTNDYNWSFVFLGMGPDTWGTGESLGIGNNIRATGSAASYGSTYAVATASVTQSRMTGDTITGLDADTK